jgi:putative toxin-antitoxin system antitoxin component (TIGR02293 family)
MYGEETMAAHPTLENYIGIAPTSGVELVKIVENGLPTQSLTMLMARGLTSIELGTVVISQRTLKGRVARGESLTPLESDRTVRVASILALADQIFVEPGKALRWLRKSHDMLRNRAPLSMLRTEPGGCLIESMLWGIEEASSATS